MSRGQGLVQKSKAELPPSPLNWQGYGGRVQERISDLKFNISKTDIRKAVSAKKWMPLRFGAVVPKVWGVHSPFLMACTGGGVAGCALLLFSPARCSLEKESGVVGRSCGVRIWGNEGDGARGWAAF